MIKQKEKPCKGINKAHGVEGCGELSLYRKAGLCPKCYRVWWLLNTDEGQQRISSVAQKAAEPRKRLEKAIEEKANRQKLQYLRVSVMNWCHKFIKLRDKGKPCVSCGQPWSPDHQAGHWKKASDYPTLKYWEFNIHNQCQGCNLAKDGNVQAYGDLIVQRITPEQKEEIERMCIEYKHNGFKWDRQELEELREYYKNKYYNELNNST